MHVSVDTTFFLKKNRIKDLHAISNKRSVTKKKKKNRLKR